MKIIAEFEIPDDVEPIQATLDYYVSDGNIKGICCAEVFGTDLKEVINDK